MVVLCQDERLHVAVSSEHRVGNLLNMHCLACYVYANAAGGAAGSSSWAIVFPADVLKSRLQVADTGTGSRIGALSLAKQLYRAHGVSVFYKGVGAAVLRAFPANGALFAGVELTRSALQKYTAS